MARQGGRSSRRALTLVELLLALLVLTVAGVGILGAYQHALHLTEVSEQSGLALNDLKDMMEKIKSTPFTQLTAVFPDGAVNGIVGGGPDQYSAIVGGYSLVQEEITISHEPSPAADPREFIVEIAWTNRGRTYYRQLATMRASGAS